MSQVTVNIDGKAYRMACEEGQEEHLTLGKWDVFSCPPEAYRGFDNASSENQAVLLTVINGDPNARDDVNVPPGITNHLRDTFGEEVLQEFKNVVKLPETEAETEA